MQIEALLKIDLKNIYSTLIEASSLPPYYYILVAVPAVTVYIVSKYKLRLTQLVAIIWGLISFFTFTFICTFFFANEDELQLTVYVHGPESNQQIILENTGKLVVDLGNDRRTAKIGENGRTNFGEIPQKFHDKHVGIGLDAPGYVLDSPSKKYILNGTPIYISIRRDNSLGIIRGMVKNKVGNKLIEGALIIISNDKDDTTTTTNRDGIFKVILPEEMQVKDERTPYILTIKKAGFKIATENYFPRSNNLEIRLNNE